jgi:exoribonuclease II
VYKHAFEVVRMDGKKRRYILAFPNEREMADWQTLIEQLISRQQSKVKRQSDARAAAHSEVHFPHTTHRKHPTNNVMTQCSRPLRRKHSKRHTGDERRSKRH